MLDNDNPYQSPRSTQREAIAIERNVMSPHWIISFAIAFGFAVGAVSSYVRPMISGHVHYEAITSLVLLILFFLISLFICLRTARPMQWMGVVIVLTWITFFVGWSLVAQRMWDDMAGVCVVGAGLSLAIALPLVFLMHRFWRPRASA